MFSRPLDDLCLQDAVVEPRHDARGKVPIGGFQDVAHRAAVAAVAQPAVAKYWCCNELLNGCDPF